MGLDASNDNYRGYDVSIATNVNQLNSFRAMGSVQGDVIKLN